MVIRGALLVVLGFAASFASGQTSSPTPTISAWGQRNAGLRVPGVSPSSALRPLGAPSIVDQYNPSGFGAAVPMSAGVPAPRVASYQPTPAPGVTHGPNVVVQPAFNTSYPSPVSSNPSLSPSSNIVQTAYQVNADQQAIGQPALMGQGYRSSGVGTGVNNQYITGNPNQQPIGPGVAPPPAYGQSGGIASQQPSQAIASMGNSNCVSPASSWTANGQWDCGQYTQVSATSVPRQYIPPEQYNPAVITPDLAPGAYAPANGGYRPLVALGKPYPNVQLGRGIIGQPTVYVPGQHFRNFFRYLSP